MFLHFTATGKFKLLGILVLSRWRNIRIQAPHVQNPVRFRRFNIVQTSRSWGQHLCSKFAKIPHLGCPRMFKVPTSSCGLPPLGHNIDSCIMNLLCQCITTLLFFDYPEFRKFLSNTLQSRNVGVRSVGTKVDFNFEKNACSFLHVGLSI